MCLHFLAMQQRAPGSQGVLKEEKLPPSPVMRGEPFNPAMRPDHHKHPDTKPSQPGHSQQSAYDKTSSGYKVTSKVEAARDAGTIFFLHGFMFVLFVCIYDKQM